MYRTLLVPLDGSEFAEEALSLAKVLASKMGAELHLVHVLQGARDVDFKSPQEDMDWKERAWDASETYLQRHAAEAEAEGVSVLTGVLEGRIAPSLRTYAQEQDVELIVLTTHGAGGVRRWWLGSVADELLRTSDTELLLVRPWDETDEREPLGSRFSRLLVPLDGSDAAERAIPRALEMASVFDADVRLVRTVPKPLELTSIYGMRGVELSGDGHKARVEEAGDYMKEVVQRFPGTGVEAHVVESSGAAEGVVESARELNSDLLVLSTHGRGGIARAVLGSVADKILRSTTRPVLVIRTDEESS